VAEMLGRGDKSNAAHLKARKITSRISIVVIACYGVNYFITVLEMYFFFYDHKSYSSFITRLAFQYLPLTFLFADVVLLIIALVWICKSLRHDKQVMGNEKWMALHILMLSAVGVSEGMCASLYWNNSRYDDKILTEYCIGDVLNCIAILLISLVMN
jgi:hypothetical protein